MTRNYMANWRALRKLARTECECGNAPRLAYDKGCARCELLDQRRYQQRSTTDVVRETLARFDTASVVELSVASGLGHHQIWAALRRLLKTGEAEKVSVFDYRFRRAT
jgi:hypothetical protein